MPRSSPSDNLSKFQRFRAGRRERGQKLLRLWVADPRSPTFQVEIKRQSRLLRDAPEEKDTVDFIEAVTDWRDGEV